jgi:hypothetical protein
MRTPLRFRSRDEQKAVFSRRQSYRDFCDEANKDFWGKLASQSSVKDTSFIDFNRKTNKEFNSGCPITLKDKLLTEKNMEVKHTFFGADVPYDKFWFETDARKNKFSIDEDPDFVEEEGSMGVDRMAMGAFSERNVKK